MNILKIVVAVLVAFFLIGIVFNHVGAWFGVALIILIIIITIKFIEKYGKIK
jgi:hypothetical protein